MVRTALGFCLVMGTIVAHARADAELDVHSYSRPDQIFVTTVELELTANFATHELEGTATLRFRRTESAGPDTPLVLDTRGLLIEKVESFSDYGPFRPVAFDLTTPQPVLGSKLSVWVKPRDNAVRVTYKTSPNATALQWLDPALTAGKKHPFLFTQSQAIHARSWIPLQDSPGVRVRYIATIHAPKGLKAVMSAETEPGNAAEGLFNFRMKEEIPPYLIALAIGDLEFKELGPRTGVYAEPATIAKAAHEFADTEKMVESVEKRFGPYRWGRYDLLVLPPSFPFGGMENPRLTFATPTILAGDRSLVSLVAHELAHSWSGNLVTNATWSDFWLNEGFTTYLEQRIIEDLYGKERADIERVLGLRDLQEDLAALPAPEQILHIDLTGRDPDDGVTRIPYEKGALLLTTIEEAFGREKFDKFLLGYFNKHAFTSITTSTFLDDLKTQLLDKAPEKAATIDLKTWIESPGLPAKHAMPTSKALQAIDGLAAEWLKVGKAIDEAKAKAWSTQEWVHFLQALPNDLSKAKMAELDAAFGLTKRENVEVAGQWLLMAIRSGYEPAYDRLEAFLVGIGRRKFIVPLYKELVKSPEGKTRAKAIYAKARPGYHPIAVDTIDRVVGRP